ncbi:hypothetical protein C8R43DRAFT_1122453 [Mycena crocata]|nr:hypothetical protein C8R43DRAFT_1122453 [Mycena crocata]
MPCSPPYYPSPGHEDRQRHDQCAACFYYVVMMGRVNGVFTNSWIARDVVSGTSHGSQKACKNWREVEFYWGVNCDKNHIPGECPVFQTSLDFSLDPASYPYPATGPCTAAPTADATSSSSLASSSAAPAAAPPPAPTAAVSPSVTGPAAAVVTSRSNLRVWDNDPGYPNTYTAPRSDTSFSSISSASSLSASSTSSFTSSPSRSPSQNDSVCVLLLPAGSPFNPTRQPKPEPRSPCPKKEEPQELFLAVPRVTASTRIQLSPTGEARAAALQRAANPSTIATPQRQQASPSPFHTLSPSPPSTPLARAPSSHTSSTPSVIATPAPNAAGVVVAAAPAPPTPVRQYGVRGVGIFYSLWAAAHAAAVSLGLDNSKIMVTDNLEKLEAWITGRPFVGDDGSL